jgi:hypothetical protein
MEAIYVGLPHLTVLKLLAKEVRNFQPEHMTTANV